MPGLSASFLCLALLLFGLGPCVSRQVVAACLLGPGGRRSTVLQLTDGELASHSTRRGKSPCPWAESVSGIYQPQARLDWRGSRSRATPSHASRLGQLLQQRHAASGCLKSQLNALTLSRLPLQSESDPGAAQRHFVADLNAGDEFRHYVHQ